MKMFFFGNKLINQQIKNYLEEEIKKYGEVKYAYLIMNKTNPMDVIIINNHNDWFELYIKGNYQLIDPVIINAMERVDDFEWDDKIMIYSEMKLPKIFKKSEKYNIKQGHTFTLHDYKNNLVVLSLFNTNLQDKNLKEIIQNNQDKLQQILIKTHKRLLSLYEDIEKNSNKFKSSILSNRENEILYWVSMGRSYQDIAKILGIKSGTIKFHMSNIVKKLGVYNAKHAIKLATELKIIQMPSG